MKSFLDSANEAYATSQSRNLTPNMTNISVSDFLSLNVVSDSVIEMSGKQYEYQIFSDQSLVNFKNYNVTSTLGIVIPGLGGAEYTVKFSKDDSIIEEFKVPIYQRPWITYSVIAFTHPVEHLLFLSLNYNTGRLNSANIPEIASMWLILCPMQ